MENSTTCNTISLLQGEELSFNRLLSRDPSNGFSSRVYYRGTGHVPFQWESQPGKPKVVKECDLILAPLSPPPAVLSLHLARECTTRLRSSSKRSSVWFWKKGRRGSQATKGLKETSSEERSLAMVDSLGLWSSEGDESCSSPQDLNSSPPLLSSSFSSFDCPTPEKKFLVTAKGERGVERMGWALSCTPWNYNGVKDVHG